MMRQYEKVRMEDHRKKRSSALLTLLRGLMDVDAPIRISFPSLLRFATMHSALAPSFVWGDAVGLCPDASKGGTRRYVMDPLAACARGSQPQTEQPHADAG